MIRFFLTRVLAWAAKISWADFLRIVGAAQTAAAKWPKSTAMTTEAKAATNAARVEGVNAFIGQAFPQLTGWALNVIRELAVAWLNRA